MTRKKSLPLEVIRNLVPIAVFAFGVIGFVALSNSRQAAEVLPEEEKLPVVQTMAALAHTSGLDFEVDGLVDPAREMELAAEVDGRVVFKAPECDAGRFVSKGTVLLRIDPQDYQLEMRRLAQELEQADANINELDVQISSTENLIELANEDLELRRRELSRQENIGRGAVAASQLDEARRGVLTAKNSLQSLQNELNLFRTRRLRLQTAQQLVQTQLERAELDLARTEVKAPASGVVISEMVEQDGYVRRGDPLVVLEDTSTVEVRCSLRMEQLAWLWRQPRRPKAQPPLPPGESAAPGADATEIIRPNASRKYELPKTPVSVAYRLGGVEHIWEGVLDRFDGLGLDEQTRTAPCRVVVLKPSEGRSCAVNSDKKLDMPSPALVRGMFVTVRIHAQPKATLLSIPERAVRPGNKAWVVRGGELHSIPLQVAALSGGRAIVDAEACPLAAQDRLVVSPLAYPRDGMKIEEERLNESLSSS